mmetsp:Transcript_5522/g.9064  ORF Transcript_5522/g.9064 Transcript_5522/m.9064 type:complete len:232 (+) Transcript_5522:365-1060(+)
MTAKVLLASLTLSEFVCYAIESIRSHSLTGGHCGQIREELLFCGFFLSLVVLLLRVPDCALHLLLVSSESDVHVVGGPAKFFLLLGLLLVLLLGDFGGGRVETLLDGIKTLGSHFLFPLFLGELHLLSVALLELRTRLLEVQRLLVDLLDVVLVRLVLSLTETVEDLATRVKVETASGSANASFLLFDNRVGDGRQKGVELTFLADSWTLCRVERGHEPRGRLPVKTKVIS